MEAGRGHSTIAFITLCLRPCLAREPATSPALLREATANPSGALSARVYAYVMYELDRCEPRSVRGVHAAGVGRKHGRSQVQVRAVA